MIQLRRWFEAITQSRHVPVIIILCVATWLLVGAASAGSTKAVSGLALFAASTALTYTSITRLVRAPIVGRMVDAMASYLSVGPSLAPLFLWGLALIAAGISVVHYVRFDGFTLFNTLAATDNFEAALVREGLKNDVAAWMRYLSGFAVKSLFPMVLLFAIVYRRPGLVAFTAITGALYAVCMMQKSFPIFLLLPTIMFYVVTLRPVRLLVTVCAVVFLVLFMGMLANPSVVKRIEAQASQSGQPGLSDQQAQLDQQTQPENGPPRDSIVRENSVTVVGNGLIQRIIATPGAVAAQWFDLIPSAMPFGEGCGYRLVADLRGCDFINYPSEIYRMLYPRNFDRGLHGSVNAGSMMPDYANFGFVGLGLSGIIHAIIAWTIGMLFRGNIKMILPVNLTYLALLSSTALSTALLSGGWALSILIFLLVGQHKPGHEGKKHGYDRTLAALAVPKVDAAA